MNECKAMDCVVGDYIKVIDTKYNRGMFKILGVSSNGSYRIRKIKGDLFYYHDDCGRLNSAHYEYFYRIYPPTYNYSKMECDNLGEYRIGDHIKVVDTPYNRNMFRGRGVTIGHKYTIIEIVDKCVYFYDDYCEKRGLHYTYLYIVQSSYNEIFNRSNDHMTIMFDVFCVCDKCNRLYQKGGVCVCGNINTEIRPDRSILNKIKDAIYDKENRKVDSKHILYYHKACLLSQDDRRESLIDALAYVMTAIELLPNENTPFSFQEIITHHKKKTYEQLANKLKKKLGISEYI